MPASKAKPSSKTAAAATRTAGFVLGVNWLRPGSPAAPEVVPAPAHAADVFQGIITHYVEPDLRPKLKASGDSLRLVEDLGLDSLDMIEVMLRVEDLLKIRVSDHELRHFRTLGEVRQFIDRSAQAPVAG